MLYYYYYFYYYGPTVRVATMISSVVAESLFLCCSGLKGGEELKESHLFLGFSFFFLVTPPASREDRFDLAP
ncbi:hypothetical protein I7I53_06864 [Histoplasma capsulatum var. duboisii H88]|uniref:Uncharacterized protein n=1 Tax=Ajellomyces capsulatus (strain H88) TaxID=544711 RepID=A0A8A1LBT8_AJEC8|nr:hypothetical protein I7I53_06864 [Histoplasma capsulatum var. duboisii H88]